MRPAPYQAETAQIEETFHLIMEDIKKGAAKYTQEYEKLTSEIMGQIASNLKKNLNGQIRYNDVTPEMIADSVMERLAPLELNEAKQAEVRELMLTLCTNPRILAEQNKSDSESQNKEE